VLSASARAPSEIVSTTSRRNASSAVVDIILYVLYDINVVMDISSELSDIVQVRQGVPAYRALSERAGQLIRNGTLRAGDRLPTARALAAATGLDKATICKAFAELQREGLVASRPGRGTVVREAVSEPPPVSVARRVENLYGRLRSEYDSAGEPVAYDFSALWPEPDLFPLDALRRTFEKLLRGEPALLQYGSPQGYPPLREYLSKRAAEAGVRGGEVVIVQGSQQGLDLVFRSFLNPGDAVAVESPTYASVLPHLAFHETPVVPIPMEADGLNMAALESAVRRDRAKILYFMPNFQNPTGITMSERKRGALARFAASSGLLLVEDDFERDLRFAGRSLRAVTGRIASTHSIYLSSFSKSLLPGLRLGWMVVPDPLLRPIVLAKKYTDIYTSVLTQAALLDFCATGRYDRHLRRVRRVCQEKVSAAHRAVRASMPPGTSCAMPEGGFSLWVTLPAGQSAEALATEALRHGVRITPGSVFDPEGRSDGSFRLSLSLAPAAQIEPGIRILGKLARSRAQRHQAGTDFRSIL